MSGSGDGATARISDTAILVGGVGHLYQGDLDLGRLAAERLATEDLGAGARVEDVHYGAIAFAQLLEDVRPDALVLVGAAERGRPPGTVERRRIRHVRPSPSDARGALEEAGLGYLSLDLAIEVPAALGALPSRTVAVEVEPARVDPSESLSGEAAVGLEEALDLVRTEVRRAPLLGVAHRVGDLLRDGHLEPSPAAATMEDLIGELRLLDEEGRWGTAFALKDRAKLRIAAGESGEGMTRLDWSLWWGLIEELDRLEPLEALA